MLKQKMFILIAGMLLFLFQTTFSQTIGIKAGPVYNSFISSQQHVKSNLGIVAGLDYTIPLNEDLGLCVGLEYLQLGGGLLIVEDNTRYGLGFTEVPYPIKTRDSKVTLHTVNLPIFADYLIYNTGDVNFIVGIGPEVSYTISAYSRETVTAPVNSGVYVTFDQTSLETNNYKQFNVAGAAKLRVQFPFLGNEGFVDYRYRYGFTPIREGYSYLDLSNIKADMYESSFILTLGYSINL